MELVALLLVVCEHGAQTVGAGADEHGKAMARHQPGGNDSAHVRGCSWGVRMFPGAQCRKVATVTVITAGDGMTRGKEEMMTLGSSMLNRGLDGGRVLVQQPWGESSSQDDGFEAQGGYEEV